MAYGLPDNLWIGLLVMAVIILAILWRDKVSKSSGGGGGTSRDEGPSVSMRKTGSTTVGEGFALRGSYDPGDGSISDYSLTMNGRDISGEISSWSGGTFATDTIEVPDVDTVECDIQVSATYGTADDSISFNPSRPDEPEGPDLEVDVETQDADPGEDNGAVTVTASPTPGDNPIQETQVELPDFEVSDTSTGNSTASVRQTGIPPGDGYRYIARTTDGETTPVEETGTFRIRGHHEGRLRVEANHEIIDESEGEVRIWAEVVSSPAEIQGTTIKFRPVGSEDWRGDRNDGDRVEVTEKFPPGTYEYEGLAVDVEENRDTDSGTFQIGGDGTGTRDEFPELVRVVNQFSSHNFGDMGGFQGDQEVMSILEQILEQVDSSGGDGETARVGMDAYQLLFALSVLQPDLSGSDNQQIVSELQQIRQSVEQNQMSSNQLENSMRTVLHDIFGQDLQSVLEGLEVDGFDEQTIVQAIRNNQVDIDPLTARLANIEQAINQLQTQGGGDFGNLEQKLSEIESAIRDTQIDEGLMQQFTSQLQNMESEGVDLDVDVEGGMDEAAMMRLMDEIQDSGDPEVEMEQILEVIREQGRLNRELLRELIEKEDDDSGRHHIDPSNMVKDPGESEEQEEELSKVEENLDNKIQVEIEELETEYENLQKMVEQTDDIERLEENLNHDIEEVVNHLKKARQYEHHLKKHQNGQLENSQVKELLQEDIPKIRSEIKRADKALRQLKKDMRNMRKDYSELTDLEQNFNSLVEKLAQQKEALDNTEQMLEDTENKLMDSGISTID